MKNISTQKRNESDKLELILLEIGVKDFKLPEVSGYTYIGALPKSGPMYSNFNTQKVPKLILKTVPKFRSFVEPYRDF